MKSPIFLLILVSLISISKSYSQCNLVPTITGDPVLCPFSTAELQTQKYDTYQWYSTPYGGQTEAIPGATGQFLTITENDILSTIHVEVTQDTCIGISSGVLVDGHVFLLPSVMHTGNYTFDPETESFVICRGDTMFLQLLMPYEVNITWFRDGAPMPGEETTILAVSEEGNYTVEGAPGICPDYIQPLGLVLPVTVEECTSTTDPGNTAFEFEIYPNPARDYIILTDTYQTEPGVWSIVNALGLEVRRQQNQGEATTIIDLEGMPPGYYMVYRIGRDKIQGARSLILWE